MKIAIFPNYEKAGTEKLLDDILAILGTDAECLVASDGVNEDDLYKTSDLIITVGGDGTLIKHSKNASPYGKACLGVNTGRLGFLANVDGDKLDLLKRLASGDYSVESRMMLWVSAVKNDEIVYEGTALNDAVISSGSVARITDINMEISGDKIEYRADGIIISTPTGSTAYSMSAGGPIIDPSVRCITVTPICSHSLTARPILSAEDGVMKVSLSDTSRTHAFLTVDGERCCEVDHATKIIIKKSPFDAKFINLTGSTIYKTLSFKF